MARRERKVTGNGPDRRPAKSAGFRKNPRKHAGTVGIRRKKAPTENSWGFNNGGLGSLALDLETRMKHSFFRSSHGKLLQKLLHFGVGAVGLLRSVMVQRLHH